MSYRDLDVGQVAREATTLVHRMTLEDLPKFEMYEEGGQIRRSCKSCRSTIVEGYGRRRYKQDFIKFLTYAHASCDESIDHLDTLVETGSLKDTTKYEEIHALLDTLGRKLNSFIRSVESQHMSVKEDAASYDTDENLPEESNSANHQR